LIAKVRSPYSAAEQGLGFIYQPRLALLKILSLPESTSVLIEKCDDLEFDTSSGKKSLASLKHKSPGNLLTDLDTDFWKSVRVWLKYYCDNGRIASNANFILFTTAEISGSSFLTMFGSEAGKQEGRRTKASEVLAQSKSAVLAGIRDELDNLQEEEADDFYNRITIFDGSLRITDIPQQVIDQHLRTIRRESRTALFERLEGWWFNLMIGVLSGERTDPIYGIEVSDKLSAIAEEYRSDSLPITFRGKLPDGTIDPANDPRLFVEQLRDLDLSATRIRNAIIDYYRAFEQRSSWARENLLILGEMEEYEDRLINEWSRYREVVFESVQESNEDETFKALGRELYRWAELETQSLRIRERVTEPYVIRGAFHILANSRPNPRIFWNPLFMKRLSELLGVAA
jgi:hypothetical protein